MRYLPLHPWEVDTKEAIEIQKDLAARVSVKDELVGPTRYVAGMDISPPDANGNTAVAAVRTLESVNPIYVSIGHMMSLENALKLTLTCCKGYRMLESTRLAHLAATGRISPE